MTSLVALAFRFGVVGLGSVSIYFIALYILRPLIDSTIGLTAAAYVISAVFNFTLQNFFTFRAQGVHIGKVIKYLAMHGICLTINSGLMYIFVDLAGQNLYLSQLVTTSLVTVVSFLMSYNFVYKD